MIDGPDGYDESEYEVRRVYRCEVCAIPRPVDESEGVQNPSRLQLECYGPCENRTSHTRESHTLEWNAVRIDAECPDCGYDTMLFEASNAIDIECPACPPVGPDMTDLTAVSGVNDRIADILEGSGVHAVDQLRSLSQSQIKTLASVGNARAARIKAGADRVVKSGDRSTLLIWTDVVLARDVSV